MRASRLYAILLGLLCVSVLNAVLSQAASEGGWPLKATVELNAETHNSHSLWLRDPRSPLSSMQLRVTPDVNDANEVMT